MKILLMLFVVWWFVPSAKAEWSKRVIEDHFDPLKVLSTTGEINTPNPSWRLGFMTAEGIEVIAFYLINTDPLSSLLCSVEDITIKSKVDNVLTPLEVEFGYGHGISIANGNDWLQVLSSANHLRVRVTDKCSEDFDIEFDVSGTPDLSPLNPQ